MDNRRGGDAARAAGERGAARGQALVEFALVATVMVLLLSGLAQFGLIFERQIGINNAVREAARRGATQATDAGNAATNAAWTLGELQTLLANSQDYDSAQARNLEVCFHTPAGSDGVDAAGNSQVVVTVSAGYAHPVFLPLINVILDDIDGTHDNAFRLNTSAQFRVEQSGSVDIGAGDCATAP